MEPLGSRKFVCDVEGCNQSYFNQKNLNYHQMSHQSGDHRRYYCDRKDCWRHFAKERTSLSHIQSDTRHLLTNGYVCGHNEDCLFKTKSRDELEAHFAAKHSQQSEMLSCNWKDCELEFLGSGPLELHMQRHWRSAGTECGICLVTFATPNLLLKHRSLKHVTMYRCDQCEYETDKKHSLFVHRHKHRREKLYKCSLNDCVKAFNRMESVHRHQLLKHPQEFPLVPWIQCPKCRYKCKYYRSMNHHRSKPCSKRFSYDRPIASKRHRLTTNKTDDNDVNNDMDTNIDDDNTDQTNTEQKQDNGSDDNKDNNLVIACDNSISDDKFDPKSELRAKRSRKWKPGSKKYRCNACDFTTDDRPEMFVHRERQHGLERQFKCQLGVDCNRTFKNQSQLRDHQLFRHPEEMPDFQWLQCPQPNCTFRTINNCRLKMHLSEPGRHLTRPPKPKMAYVCDWLGCGRRCVSQSSLATHKDRHKTIDSFKCDHPGCDKLCTTIGYLNVHKKSHGNKYSCDTNGCPFTTGFISELKKHGLVRHTDRQVCGIDGCIKLLNVFNPKAHQIACHPQAFPDMPWIECNESDCTYRTKYKHTMDKHRDKHTKPYRCDVCQRGFGTKSSRDEHLRTHNDDMKLKCDWPGCESKFTTDDALRDHFNTHTQETIYRCNWSDCDKTFLQRTSLIHHQRKHKQSAATNNLPIAGQSSNPFQPDVYRCHWPECLFETRYKPSLNRHIDGLHKGFRTSAPKRRPKKCKRKRK